MCGVIAVVGKGHGDLVRGGMPHLAHRGIRSKVADGPGWSIGHVRLPIVGIDEGNDQPVEADGQTVAWVGEILGFRDQHPDMRCDTDLVVKTYLADGPRGFYGFDGFWSVVAGDRGYPVVQCFVDYLAQKPLYVRVGDGWTAVASEPVALARLAPIELDPVYLGGVVRWGYWPSGDRTPFKGMYKIGPGQRWAIEPNGYSTQHPSEYDRVIPESVGLVELRRRIVEAVRVRVQSSDVPVAALVSGGLDSAIVRHLASGFGTVQGYHSSTTDEEGYARMVDPGVRVVLGTRRPDPDLVVENMQEPVDLGSVIPQMDLSDGIANTGGERVCLTGDGADELFGGYGRNHRYDSQASDVWSELVQYHLPRLDRVMMRNRIEVRSPFLARPVVRAALGLPRYLRKYKAVLKELFYGEVPHQILVREKVPLRSDRVAKDREGWTRELVQAFIKEYGGSFDA